MTEEHNPKQATPPATLEDHIMDPNVPKSEAEWWAYREITQLRHRPSTPPAVSDDLVEEIAEILFEKSDGEFPMQHAEYLARAILPIIQRREQQAAEAMRERCAAEADANRHEECEVAEAIATTIRSLTTEEKP